MYRERLAMLFAATPLLVFKLTPSSLGSSNPARTTRIPTTNSISTSVKPGNFLEPIRRLFIRQAPIHILKPAAPKGRESGSLQILIALSGWQEEHVRCQFCHLSSTRVFQRSMEQFDACGLLLTRSGLSFKCTG